MVEAAAGGALSGGIFGGFGAAIGQGRNAPVTRVQDGVQTENPANSQTIENVQGRKHTPQMQQVIKEYLNSTNNKIVEYVNRIRQNPKSKEVFSLGVVADRKAQDIANLVGFDPSGYTEQINPATVIHIDNRHGVNGLADNSMADTNDIARIKYVLDNYDNVVLDPTRSKAFSDKNGKAARKIVMSKRINGTYYIVEAVPESAAKKLHIVSAYKIKADQQAPLTNAVGSTVKTAPDESALLATIIPQQQNESNNSIVEQPRNILAPLEAEIKAKREREMQMGEALRVSGLVNNDAANKVNRRTRRAVDAMAKKLGVKVMFDSTLSGEQGSYDPDNREIHIALDSADPIGVVMTHEVTHRLKETSPEQYEQLKSLAFEIMRENGSYDNVLASVADAYGNDTALIEDEMVAHFTRVMTEDIATFERLAGVDRDLAQKLFDLLDELLRKAGWDNNANVALDSLFGDISPQRLQSVRNSWAQALQNADAGAVGSGNVNQMFVLAKDPNVIAQAEQMERAGASRENVWNNQNVIRDTKGNWIREIDDSKAEFRPEGDAKLLSDPLYQRLQELTERWMEPDFTAEEEKELEFLSEHFYDDVWAEKYELQDFLKHDELYNEIPLIRHASVRFEDLPDGARGYYRDRDRSIVLSKNLFGKGKEVILHEIQHALQNMQKRPTGSNQSYWENRVLQGEVFHKNAAAIANAERRYRELFDSAPEELKNKIREINRAKLKKDYDLVIELEETLYNDERYSDLFSKIDNADFERRADRGEELTPGELYLNTAGEIEARQTASRANINANERRANMPDLGWDRAVFADDTLSYSYDDSLLQQFKDWMSGKMPPKGYFEIGNTPAILRKHGALNLPIIMEIDAALKFSTDYKNHAIAIEEAAKLPSQLERPILLFKGSVRNSFVVLTEIKDKNGNDVIAAIHLNRYQDRLKVNRIASIYGKDNVKNYVTNQISSGNLIDADTKKAPIWFTSRGLQLPKLVQTIIDANNSKAQTEPTVNTQSMQNSGNNTQKSRPLDPNAINRKDEILQQLQNAPKQQKPAAPVKMDADLDESIEALMYDIDANEMSRRARVAAKAPNEKTAELLSNTDNGIIQTNGIDDSAQLLGKVTFAANKTISQVLDQAVRGSKGDLPLSKQQMQQLRNNLYNAIEKPLNEAKAKYVNGIKSKAGSFAQEMARLGIKPGSKESAAAQWIGEGQRQGPDGKNVEYTLADLQQQFPNKWQNILECAQICRKYYDAYITEINDALKIVYPDVEARAAATMDKINARVAYNTNQAQIWLDKATQLEQRLSAAQAESHNADSMAATKTAARVNRLANQLDTANQTAERYTRAAEAARAKAEDLQRMIDSGEILRNKRLVPRKDYFHHFNEMEQGLGGFVNIISGAHDISAQLAGKSEFTKPKSKWWSALQQRAGGKYTADAVGGMARYIPAAEYKIAFDPFIAQMRGNIEALVNATEKTKYANSLIEYLTDWTNDLAGKTNFLDRPFQKLFDRRSMKALEFLNNRAKANAVAGNLGSAIVQIGNIPNAMMFINNPADWARAAQDIATGNNKEGQSVFLNERYIGNTLDKLQKSSPIKDATNWMLEIGDRQAARLIWNAAYNQFESGRAKGLRQYENAVDYADDITRRSIAGRGVGEMALTQKSRIVKLFAPFQVEVNNTYNLMVEKLGEKDAAALMRYAVGAFAINWLMQAITGRRPLFDPIDALIEAVKGLLDEEDERTAGEKTAGAISRLGGEVVSNIPYASTAATMLTGTENSEKIFGEEDPTRYGTGNIALQTLTEPIGQFINGEKVDLLAPATSILPAYGGKQIERTVRGAQSLGYLPRVDIRSSGVDIDRNEFGASRSASGRIRFPITEPADQFKTMLFGEWSTSRGKDYINEGLQPLSEKQSEAMEKAFAAGISPDTYYDAVLAARKAVSQKDAKGKTIPLSQDRDKVRLIKEAVPGLTAKEYKLLFEALDISKNAY